METSCKREKGQVSLREARVPSPHVSFYMRRGFHFACSIQRNARFYPACFILRKASVLSSCFILTKRGFHLACIILREARFSFCVFHPSHGKGSILMFHPSFCMFHPTRGKGPILRVFILLKTRCSTSCSVLSTRAKISSCMFHPHYEGVPSCRTIVSWNKIRDHCERKKKRLKIVFLEYYCVIGSI